MEIATFEKFRIRLGQVLSKQIKWKRQLDLLLEIGYEGPEVAPIFTLWENYKKEKENGNEYDKEYIENLTHDTLMDFLYPPGAGIAPEWVSNKLAEYVIDLLP
jgi:hypothetical protein